MLHYNTALQANIDFRNPISDHRVTESSSSTRDIHHDIAYEREFCIFNGISCGVVLIDKNHEIVWLNEEMETLFCIHPDTALGMHALFFLSACILPRIEEAERLGREYIRAFMEKSEESVRSYRVCGEEAKTDMIEYWGFWVSRGREFL